MPYITQESRKRLERSKHPITSGELNYLFTLEMIRCWNRCMLNRLDPKIKRPILKFPKAEIQAIAHKYLTENNLRYQLINDVIGAIQCFIFEFVRRKKTQLNKKVKDILINSAYRTIAEIYITYASNYEDKKIKENGDVY